MAGIQCIYDKNKKQEEKVLRYDDVFKMGTLSVGNKIKIKVIQGMIQNERPTNWTISNIMKIANEIKWTEIYNAKKTGKLEVTESIWNILPIDTHNNNN